MARAFIKSVLLASEDFIRNLFIISVLCSKVGCVCAMHQNKKKKTKIDLHALLNYKTKGIKPAFNRLQKATSKPKYLQAKLVLAEKMVRSFLSNKWSFSNFSNYQVQDIPTELYLLTPEYIY